MSNNVDLNSIREYYASMYDDEILTFARDESFRLTGDAFLVLRQELNKRGIGADILEKIEHDIILRASIDKQKAIENFNKNLYEDAIEFAFSEKAKGMTNYGIYAGLIEKGIDEETSNTIVNRLDEWTEKLIKETATEIQAGVGILIIGIIAVFVTFKIERFEIGAILLVLIGAMRTAIYASKKSKFKTILNNIHLENEKR